jgi:hypothetical protein
MDKALLKLALDNAGIEAVWIVAEDTYAESLDEMDRITADELVQLLVDAVSSPCQGWEDDDDDEQDAVEPRADRAGAG